MAYVAMGTAILLGGPSCGNTSVDKPSKSKVSKKRKKRKKKKQVQQKPLEERVEETKIIEEPVEPEKPVVEPSNEYDVPDTLTGLADLLCKPGKLKEYQKHIKLNGGYVAELTETARIFEITHEYRPRVPPREEDNVFYKEHPNLKAGEYVFYKFTMIYDPNATVSGKKFGFLRCAFDFFLDEQEKGGFPEWAIINDFRANGIFEVDQNGTPVDSGILKDFKGVQRNMRKDQFDAMVRELPEILQEYTEQTRTAEKESNIIEKNKLIKAAEMYVLQAYNRWFKNEIPK
jgi:hypothetical protein